MLDCTMHQCHWNWSSHFSWFPGHFFPYFYLANLEKCYPINLHCLTMSSINANGINYHCQCNVCWRLSWLTRNEKIIFWALGICFVDGSLSKRYVNRYYIINLIASLLESNLIVDNSCWIFLFYGTASYAKRTWIEYKFNYAMKFK